MAITSNDIANQAIQYPGDNQASVQGLYPNFDNNNTTLGKILNRLYGPCVQTVGRQFGWDFARNIVALTASGNAGPFGPAGGFQYEYLYPGNGVQVWQLFPAAAADVNNPLPVNWSVGNNIVAAAQVKVIWANQAAAGAAYNNNPNEGTWDPGFREAVVRLLASELAMAGAGKPDLAQSLVESGSGFEQIAEQRTN